MSDAVVTRRGFATAAEPMPRRRWSATRVAGSLVLVAWAGLQRRRGVGSVRAVETRPATISLIP